MDERLDLILKKRNEMSAALMGICEQILEANELPMSSRARSEWWRMICFIAEFGVGSRELSERIAWARAALRRAAQTA
jgi:hypothetical protein